MAYLSVSAVQVIHPNSNQAQCRATTLTDTRAVITTQECARDLLSRDRDETRDPCLQDQDKTETFKILSEMRRCSFRDAGRDLEAPKTLKSRFL